MHVLIPRLSGFCPGVKQAERKLFEACQAEPPGTIAILGLMINNRRYIDYITRKGIRTVEDTEGLPEGSPLMIRTHGISRFEEERLKKRYRLFDLTCRNVKRVQLKIRQESERGAFVLITGKKSHPEVKGLESYANHFRILETEADREEYLSESRRRGTPLPSADYTSLFLVSQTTGSRSFFEETIAMIEEAWSEIPHSYFDSICPITNRKEREALQLQKEADVSFVIGDHISSNANKLYQKLRDGNDRTYLIQDLKELKTLQIPLSRYRTALIVSSASTPEFVEQEVTDYLSAITPL